MRRQRTPDGTSTIGELFIDNAPERECYTLEDPEVLGPKVHGQTAIPTGLYRVAITMSPRFGRPLPLLLNVPGFDGIRIHPGNDAGDTEGCILLGQTKADDFIGKSQAAFKALYPKIESTLADGGEVWMNITHAP